MSSDSAPRNTTFRDWLGLVPLALAIAAVGGFSLWQAFSGGASPGDIDPVPNVTWTGVSHGDQKRATRILNDQDCTCGCGMKLAKCRKDDPTCPLSPTLAERIIAMVKEGKPDAEIIAAIPKMAAQTTASDPKPAEDPNTVARVKVDVGDAPALGPTEAPVTIVEFIDYQCPFCQKAHATVETLKRKYGDKVRLVFIQNPLEIHPDAPLAAEAALAAGEQGKFLEMHNRLLENQDHLARGDLVEHARKLGLNVAKFQATLGSGRFKPRVEANLKLAETLGVTGTPHFFINGRSIIGAKPIEQFEKIIAEELSGNVKPTRWVEKAR